MVVEPLGTDLEDRVPAGATRVHIGQSGDDSWVVLADPEGNELCVLSCRALPGLDPPAA